MEDDQIDEPLRPWENANFEEPSDTPKHDLPRNYLAWVVGGSIVSFALTILITLYFTKEYGFALFLGIPTTAGFMIGFTSPLAGFRPLRILSIVTLITCIICFLLMLLKIEGAICIVMILVPLFVLVLIGFILGKLLRRVATKDRRTLALFFMINPACIAADLRADKVENTMYL